jgi:hypothetical protein
MRLGKRSLTEWRAHIWCCHSLSVVMLVIGLGCYLEGLLLHLFMNEWLRTSDFAYNIGHGFFPLAIYNFGAGKLREINKPEE